MTFVAGLFSAGVQRIALVSCSFVVFLIYLLNGVRHFGDLGIVPGENTLHVLGIDGEGSMSVTAMFQQLRG